MFTRCGLEWLLHFLNLTGTRFREWKPRGYSTEILLGVYRPVLTPNPYFRPKNIIFYAPFQNWSLKFKPGYRLDVAITNFLTGFVVLPCCFPGLESNKRNPYYPYSIYKKAQIFTGKGEVQFITERIIKFSPGLWYIIHGGRMLKKQISKFKHKLNLTLNNVSNFQMWCEVLVDCWSNYVVFLPVSWTLHFYPPLIIWYWTQ